MAGCWAGWHGSNTSEVSSCSGIARKREKIQVPLLTWKWSFFAKSYMKPTIKIKWYSPHWSLLPHLLKLWESPSRRVLSSSGFTESGIMPCRQMHAILLSLNSSSIQGSNMQTTRVMCDRNCKPDTRCVYLYTCAHVCYWRSFKQTSCHTYCQTFSLIEDVTECLACKYFSCK